MPPGRRLFPTAAIAVFLLTIGPCRAIAADPMLAPDAVDWAELVGPPPKAGSQQAHEDLAIVLWMQRTRSRADVDRVWAATSPGVDAFQQAIGTMLLPEAYPQLHAAIQAALDAASPVFFSLKSRWGRPRPQNVDARVKPCTPTPASGSYPSGTAALGIVAGRLLADLIPERKAKIADRADEIAELRVTAGAHFPSDVEAGVKLGDAIADRILTSEAWAERRKAVGSELPALRAQLPEAGN